MRVPKRLAKYLEMLKITFSNSLVYLHDLLIGQLFLVVIMFVFVKLWQTTYRWEGASTIGGYTLGQMIWYLAIGESILMGMPRTARVVDDDVKSGALAYALAKPYKYPWFLYARHMGEAAVGFTTSFLVSGSVTWIMVGPPPFGLVAFALGTLLVSLAVTLDFWIQISIGLSAFWIEDSSPYRLLYSRINMLLGGMMLPLEVFPDWLRQIATKLPGSRIVYVPVRAFVDFSFGEFFRGLGTQVAWILVFMLVASTVYRAGVTKVNVQGG